MLALRPDWRHGFAWQHKEKIMAHVSKPNIIVPQSLRRCRIYYEIPLSVDDIEEFITKSRAKVSKDCNFTTATGAINESIQLYAAAMRDISTASEFKTWFQTIELSANDLLVAFGKAKADQNRAAFHFWERPSVYYSTRLNASRIMLLLRGIEQLRDGAKIAADGVKLKGHRSPGTPRVWLRTGLQRAWITLTGQERPPLTRASDGTPSGPFIRFATDVLATAAVRLEASKHPHLAAIAPSLQDFVKKPDKILDLYRTRGK
jgi:hypothetical protein